MATNPDVTPSMTRVKQTAKLAGWGALGGIGVLAGRQLFGGSPFGGFAGGAVAGGMIGGTTGDTITVTSAMDAMIAAGI